MSHRFRHTGSFAGHKSRIFDLSFQNSGRCALASASEDETCQVWDLGADGLTYEPSATLHGHSDAVLKVSWQRDSQIIATGSRADR